MKINILTQFHGLSIIRFVKNGEVRNMLFDEKIGGTVHMAIGDSMPEAGGKNKSSLHWDMLCDMRNGGKIYADGELFYENGKFIDSILEKYNIK